MIALEAELKSAVSRAVFAEQQLATHTQGEKIEKLKRDTVLESKLEQRRQWLEARQNILLPGPRPATTSSETNEAVADSTATSPQDPGAVGMQAKLQKIRDEMREQQENSRLKQQENLDTLETARTEQMQKQLTNQQEEMQKMLAAQVQSSKQLSETLTETAALRAVTHGDASIEKAVAAAMEAAGNFMSHTNDDKVLQLQQQLEARSSELKSAKQAVAIAQDTIREANKATQIEKQGKAADSKHRQIVEEHKELLEQQVADLRSANNALREELGEVEMKLAYAKVESELSESTLEEKGQSEPVPEPPLPAVAAPPSGMDFIAARIAKHKLSAENMKLMQDSTSKTLSLKLEAKEKELEDALRSSAALKKQLTVEKDQMESREQLVAQMQQQQDELQQIRLEQLNSGQQLATTLGELAAATSTSNDPSAVLDAISKAREAAKEAAAEQIGTYEGQLTSMQQKLDAKETAITMLKMSSSKRGEASVANDIRSSLSDEIQTALTGRSLQMELQLASQRAEIDRLHAEMADKSSEKTSADDQSSELARQLSFAKDEVQAEREWVTVLRTKIEKLEKGTSDLQLLSLSPVRGGDSSKRVAEDLARARTTIEEKNAQLAAVTKKELLTDRKVAQLNTKQKSVELKLKQTKEQVQKLVGDNMTLISDVKKMEDALGFKQATARQSSKLLHPRLEALQGMLKRSAEAEREVSKKSRLLLLYRQKLQESDLDELWKRYGGEDQKELLRISNTTCQAVRTQAFATRKELVAQQLRLKDAERDRDDIPEESEECWDVRRHVVERIEFALSFIEGVVDAANLRKNLNDATWELCKPGYGDVRR